MTFRSPVGRTRWVSASWVMSACVAAAAFDQAAQKPVPPVAAVVLQKLLPAIDGWTSGVARTDLVEMSADAKYSIATVTLTKEGHRVRLSIADTGFSSDSLTALATMVMTMPEDYAGDVGGMAIKRTVIAGSPAVEAWDAAKSAGEVAVVVGGRFVVSLEALKLDSLATLKGILEKVDLKALAALK